MQELTIKCKSAKENIHQNCAKLYMIGWIYSDPLHTGFGTGVTRGRQNFLEGAKKI